MPDIMNTNRMDQFVSRYGGYWRDDILDFCYLTNPYFPSQKTMDVLFAELRRAVKFYPSSQRVAAGYLSKYLGVPADSLYVGNGGSECISIMNRLFTGPMLIPVPAFNEYENNRRATGGAVELFHLTEDSGFQLDVEEFVKATRDRRVSSALVISPNNPTGNVIKRDELAYLAENTRHLDLLLVDESFSNFASRGSAHAFSIRRHLPDYPHVAVLSSMSKDYGIPGLRLGYVASGNKELVARVRKFSPIWNINALAEIFLEHLPSLKTEFEHSRVRVIESTRKLYSDLGTVSYLQPCPTYSNFIFTRVLPPFDSTKLFRTLLSKHGIFINDTSNKPNLGRRYVRIASRDDHDNARLVACLKKLDSSSCARKRKR